jgi:outer membrane lipoprotein carrier protein
MRLALVLLLLLIAAPANAADAETQRVVRLVQRHYDGIKSYQAQFEQVFRLRAQNKKKVRKGRVSFKRRSRISFRYDKPHEGRVVSDGKMMRIWDKASGKMYESKLKRSPYVAVLAFLKGKGKLRKAFRLRLIASTKKIPGHVLEAVPKQATPAYDKVLFYVEDNGSVRRVLILDAQGNSNRFELTKVKLNPAIKKREFQFSPPRGTVVVKP